MKCKNDIELTTPCSDHFSLSPHVFAEMLKFVCHLQDVEIVEDGAKHTLILYNCKVPQTGEVVFTAANAKCSANLKVKGERSLRQTSFLCRILTHFRSKELCSWFCSLTMKILSTWVLYLLNFLGIVILLVFLLFAFCKSKLT